MHIDNMDSSSKKKTMTSEEILDERINKAIDAKKHLVREALKEIESNFRNSMEGHITYHKYLMKEAREHGELAAAIRHQVMIETYESILRNYSLSNSYNNV